MAAYWIIFSSVVGVISIRTSLSIPLPNTGLNVHDSLPNLLASVLSARNGRPNQHNQIQHGQRQALFSKTAPNSFIHPTAFQRNPEGQIQIVQRDSTGQHGASIRQGIFNKRTEDSRESFEEFKVLQRHESIKKTLTRNSDPISSKPVYFDQRSFNSVNNAPQRKFQQQSSPNQVPLFLFLRNNDHSTYNNILSKEQKVTSIQDNSDHISRERDLSLFLPVIVDDNSFKKPEFRRLSIPSQFLPGFEHLGNHEPKELVDDLHGYILDINHKDSHNLISFLKQSTLESLESGGRSSSSEEDYYQGVNNYSSSETDEDNSDNSDNDSFEHNFREAYFEEDNGGEKSSEEIKDFMINPFTTRKNQGSFANSGTLYLGAPAFVPKHPQHSLTAPKRNKGQDTNKFPIRTKNLYSTISSEETSYEKIPGAIKVFRLPASSYKVPKQASNYEAINSGVTKVFRLPTSSYKVPTREPNYNPKSSARGLSQTLSGLYIKRVPKITRFPSSPHSTKSVLGIGSGSIRLIPSTLYNNKGANQGITGVLGLGQPVSVGLLQ